MNHKQWMELHEELTNKMRAITKAKNSDYTGGAEDAFKNFKLIEELGVCTTEQGFIARMTDKWSRLVGFVKGNQLQVKDESVEDTLLDLANYSLLLIGYLRSQKTVEVTKKITTSRLADGTEITYRSNVDSAIDYDF